MSLKLKDTFLDGFVTKEEITAIAPEAISALQTLKAGTGAGSDFLGWLTLPEDYDKEEFARIKIAAEKITKSCDILVVI